MSKRSQRKCASHKHKKLKRALKGKTKKKSLQFANSVDFTSLGYEKARSHKMKNSSLKHTQEYKITSHKSSPPSYRNGIIETKKKTIHSFSVEFNRMSKNSSKSHGKVFRFFFSNQCWWAIKLGFPIFWCKYFFLIKENKTLPNNEDVNMMGYLDKNNNNNIQEKEATSSCSKTHFEN